MDITPGYPHLAQADTRPESQQPHSPASKATKDSSLETSSVTANKQSSHLSSSPKQALGLGRQQSRRRSSSKPMSYGKRSESSRSNSPAIMPGLVSTNSEVTYTKKTGRISKAKKGKKVHHCEYPGCDKVYSRAEHQKRHEANHQAEPRHRCEFEGCRKPFHRADLLARHLERQHGMRMPQRASSQMSNTTSSLPNSPPAGLTARVSPYPMPPAFTPSSSPMVSSNIAESTRGGFHQATQAWGPSTPAGLLPSNSILGPGTGLLHTSSHSSDGSYSPASDSMPIHTQAYPQYYNVQARSTSHPVELPGRPYPISHSNTPELPPWNGYDVPQSSHTLGLGLEGPFPSHVGSPQLTYTTYEHPVDKLTDKLRAAAHGLDRHDRSLLRRELVNTEGMASNPDDMAVIDDETLRHYYDSYWKNFDPLFPIIHVPSLTSIKAEPLLLGSMVAIGAQLSSRPLSNLHSIAIFGLCTPLILVTELISNHSPLSDLQSVFLHEALAMYRSCSPDVDRSPDFHALCSNLLNDRALLDHNPLAMISQHPNHKADSDALHVTRANWAIREARRRILLSAAILDTHRSIFFSQPSRIPSTKVSNLPTPCSRELWDCVDIVEWHRLVSCIQLLSPYPSPNPSPNSAFETSLLQCRSFHYGTLDRLPSNDLTYHALLLASHTPISSLATVAAETWLFGRKLDDPKVWVAAQQDLRRWIAKDEASKAAWHAIQFLRDYFSRDQVPPIIGLHKQWCLYLAALVCWAYGSHRVPPAHPPSNPPLTLHECETLMWEYFDGADRTRDWTSVQLLRERGQTRGLLACVRETLRPGDGGVRGKLLVEADDVLRKLEEGRGKLCTF